VEPCGRQPNRIPLPGNADIYTSAFHWLVANLIGQ